MWHTTLLGDKNFSSTLKSLLNLQFSDNNLGLSEGRTPALEMKGNGFTGIDNLSSRGKLHLQRDAQHMKMQGSFMSIHSWWYPFEGGTVSLCRIWIQALEGTSHTVRKRK